MTDHADIAAIVQLTIDYCWALGAGGQQGCDEIIERVASALGPLDDSQHMVTNHQIRIDGDTATGRCYVHAQHIRAAAEGGSLYVVAGRYEDDYVRTGDGWRIAERRIRTRWTDGNLAVVRP